MSQLVSKITKVKAKQSKLREYHNYPIALCALLLFVIGYGHSRLQGIGKEVELLKEEKAILEVYLTHANGEIEEVSRQYEALTTNIPNHEHLVTLVGDVVAVFEGHEGTIESLEEGEVLEVWKGAHGTLYQASYEVTYTAKEEQEIGEILQLLIETPYLEIHEIHKEKYGDSSGLMVQLSVYGYV